MAMTRSEREAILLGDVSKRIRGLQDDSQRTAFLELFDKLDGENLGELVDSLFAEIKRSSHDRGRLVEFWCAASLLATPQPRIFLCEQPIQGQNTKGDVWMDFENRRYEFSCKDITNHTVELWVRDANDAIARATAGATPGLFYQLYPAYSASEKDWRGFAEWFIANHRSVEHGVKLDYGVDGRRVTSFSIWPSPKDGVRLSVHTVPGMGDLEQPRVIGVDYSGIGRKVRSRLQSSASGFSARPSATQINCLTFDVAAPLADSGVLFQSMYGMRCMDVRTSFGAKSDVPEEDGVWATRTFAMHSAAIYQRPRSIEPLIVETTVFPHPDRVDEVVDAFSNVPEYRVALTYRDVGL